MDERMHTITGHMPPICPTFRRPTWYRSGIGGWIGNHSGVKVAEERDTNVITMFDVEELGVDRAMEIALEIA